AAEVGMPAVGILSPVASGRIPPELTAARILVEDGPTLPATTAALVGTTVPLQLLSERVARLCGRNPDPIRRDEPAYLRAAEAAEG
ncbi:MAG TPA: hypothetical protein VFS32_12160, partial [Candidatus Limnocylindrales bacterium]|nr:hypothetical protein [Candidatus Limnocylindrales bacterium]